MASEIFGERCLRLIRCDTVSDSDPVLHGTGSLRIMISSPGAPLAGETFKDAFHRLTAAAASSLFIFAAGLSCFELGISRKGRIGFFSCFNPLGFNARIFRLHFRGPLFICGMSIQAAYFINATRVGCKKDPRASVSIIFLRSEFSRSFTVKGEPII